MSGRSTSRTGRLAPQTDLTPDGAQRPFPAVPRAVRANYGPWNRSGPTISGLRGVRVGRQRDRASADPRRRVTDRRSLAVGEAGDREAEELARDGPATVVSDGVRERLRGRPQGWLEPLLGGSASTRNVERCGFGEGGAAPPSIPPENARDDARTVADDGFAAVATPEVRPCAAVPHFPRLGAASGTGLEPHSRDAPYVE